MGQCLHCKNFNHLCWIQIMKNLFASFYCSQWADYRPLFILNTVKFIKIAYDWFQPGSSGVELFRATTNRFVTKLLVVQWLSCWTASERPPVQNRHIRVVTSLFSYSPCHNKKLKIHLIISNVWFYTNLITGSFQ